MLRLAEALECLGGLQGSRGDRLFALGATLLLDRLQTKYPKVFEDNLLWRHRVPGLLIIRRRLPDQVGVAKLQQNRPLSNRVGQVQPCHEGTLPSIPAAPARLLSLSSCQRCTSDSFRNPNVTN
jgi:hypothetical protein